MDLKQALAERRKQGESALKVRYCLDRDLVDEHAELASERAALVAPYLARKALLQSDARLGGVPEQELAAIDARIAEAAADVDARIADVVERGKPMTVDLVFAVIDPAQYQRLFNAHYSKGAEFDSAAFTAELTAVCFRRAEQDGKTVDLGGWDAILESMTFGEANAVTEQVYQANRGLVSAPF